MYYNDNQIPRNPITMPVLDIDEYHFDITVLGMRDLVSPGLLPIKKAYLKFSVKSILPPAQSKAVNEIWTEPAQSGPDPNIKTTLKFIANMPGKEFYCPKMTCTVYDKLYFEGMAQPIVGTFTLQIGDILASTRKHDKDTIELFGDLVHCLDHISTIKNSVKGTD